MNDAIIKELGRIVGPDRVLTKLESRYSYGIDATFHQAAPDAVVKVLSTEEVSRVLKVCQREGIPVTPRGSGTSFSGGPIPLAGGITLAMQGMNKIVEFSKGDCLVGVEPGVITGEMQKMVEAEGLYYPPDPQSADFCTIGGNIAENASGPHGVKYGCTRDYLLGLEVVLSDGEVINVGGKTIKNVTGFDLTRFFCSSEGMLGVITKAYLKLIPKPEAKVVLLVIFKEWAQGGQAVADIFANGILPTTLEIMDDVSIKAAEDYGHFGLPVGAGALLVIEVDGFKETMERQGNAIAEICKKAGALEVQVALDPAKQADAWKARKALSPATARLAPTKVSEDVTVPRSKIPELVVRLKEVGKEIGLPVVIFGHAGDGNLHPGILTDERDADQWERAHHGIELFFKHTVALGGTLSGEHGVGYMKAPFLPLEYSERAIRLMKDIKNAVDPKGILNPVKMFPDAKNPLKSSAAD
ncbi:MAG TPA: FAD-linked oxidase C-terminal domain-containing protein [Bacillota bacterium]